jgi:hypothetical protein
VTIKEKFDSCWTPEPFSNCWLWTKAQSRKGYGYMWLEGKMFRAHRLSWELYRSPIPGKLFVLHRCDVRSCVNPDHLFLGTDLDNWRDALAKKRRRSGIGQDSYSSKLTDADVLAIRISKEPHRILAERFGVDYTNIWQIKRRKTWTHI